MKKCRDSYAILFIISLCFVFTQCRKSDSPPDYPNLWQKLNAPYFGTPLDIQFTSSDTGYILGKDTTVPTGTTIIKTFNGGNTWQKIYFPKDYVSPILMSTSQINVSPFNSNILFSFSQWQRKNVVIRSVDGGYHWSIIDTTVNGAWGRYHFFSPENILRSGAFIYKSIDSGFTWSKVFDPQSGFANFDMLQFPGTEVGYTAGGITYDATNYGIMAKTADGGNTWQNVGFPFHAITGMSFINDNIGYVAMDMDYGNTARIYPGGTDLYKTINGGMEWDLVKRNIFSNHSFSGPTNLFFRNELEGFAVNDGIYHTTNGGNTWQNEGPSSSIMQLFFPNNSSCYAIDKNGNVYKRTF